MITIGIVGLLSGMFLSKAVGPAPWDVIVGTLLLLLVSLYLGV